MSIATSCSECGKSYRVGDENAGRQFKCKQCGNPVSVPGGDDWDDDVLQDEPTAPPRRPKASSSGRRPRTASRSKRPASPPPSRQRKSTTKRAKGSKKKSSSNSLVLIAAIGGGFAVVAFAVVVFLFTRGGDQTTGPQNASGSPVKGSPRIAQTQTTTKKQAPASRASNGKNNSASPPAAQPQQQLIDGMTKEEYLAKRDAERVERQRLEALRAKMEEEMKEVGTKLESMGVNFRWKPLDMAADVSLDKEHITSGGLIDPELLKELQQIKSFSLVRMLNLPISDAGMDQIAELPLNGRFVINGCEAVTDQGIAPLSHTNLTEFWMNGTELSDAALEHLKNIDSLEGIWAIEADNLTGTGLRHLHDLPNLRKLDLHGAELTEEGIEQLRGLHGLTDLSLKYSAAVNDQSIRAISGLTNLEELSLAFCQNLTDAGLVHLTGLTNLKSLDLIGCAQLTDAALIHLESLPNLMTLSTGSSRPFSEEAIERLQKALPEDATIR